MKKTTNKKTKKTILKKKIKSLFIIGLGNPEDEYKNTRHNVGRMVVEFVAKKNLFPDFKDNKSLKGLFTKGKIGTKPATLILPNSFMNNSGKVVAMFVKKTDLNGLVVVHDDLDLPIGKIKVSFNRGSGGHRGVESIIKSLKSKEFIRIRIGVSKVTPKGKLKKPKDEESVIKFIMGQFKEDENKILLKEFKLVDEGIKLLSEKSVTGLMSYLN